MLKLSEILTFTPITPIINWPKDPTIRYLAVFFDEASKSWLSGKNPESMDPFAIIDELLSELTQGFLQRIEEIRVLLRKNLVNTDFKMALNAEKMRSIYEEVYDLGPIKESLKNFLNHFIDYQRLETDLRSFFGSGRFAETAVFLKKQIKNSAFEISDEVFRKFKAKILDFITPRYFSEFLPGLKENPYSSEQNTDIYIEKNSSYSSNIEKNNSYTSSPTKVNLNPIKPLIPLANSKTFIGKRIFTSNVHSDWIYSVELYASGSFFASAGADKTVKLWDLPTRGVIKTLSAHKDTIKSLNYIENARLLASASYDKTIKLWDPFNKYLYNEIKDVCSVNQVKYIDFWKKLATGGEDNLLKFWDFDYGLEKPSNVLNGHQNAIQSILGIKDHGIVASAGWDKQVILWDLRVKSGVFFNLKGHEDWVYCLEYIDDSNLLISGAKDGVALVWDLRNMKTIETVLGVRKKVEKGFWGIRSLSYLRGTGKIAMATGDCIKVKGLGEDGVEMVMEGHKDEVMEIKYVENNRELISCSKDKTIGIWV